MAVSILVTLISTVGVLEPVQAKALDLLMQLRGAEYPSDVVILAIDDRAFQALGERQPRVLAYGPDPLRHLGAEPLDEVVSIGGRVLDRVVEQRRREDSRVVEPEHLPHHEAHPERVADVGGLVVLAEVVPVGPGGERRGLERDLVWVGHRFPSRETKRSRD